MERLTLLDASALLAHALQEPGHVRVDEELLQGCAASTLIVSETVTRLCALGSPWQECEEWVEDLPVFAIPFDRELALAAGRYAAAWKPLGLSLADRACLVTAQREQAHVLTADRSWAKLDAESLGITIEMIR